jgi:hypothetical protein
MKQRVYDRIMADKQTGTGAAGKGHKAPQGRGDAGTKNPVSAKNRSKQKMAIYT